MLSMLLAAQLTVIATAPPLPPAEAVKVLQASRSISDRTNVFTADPAEDLPRLMTTTSTWIPGSGYFRPQAFRPLGIHVVPGLVYRLPRSAARSEHRRPITDQGRTR